MLQSPLKFSHDLLKYYVNSGDTTVDATVGNGNDTVKLASLVGKTGKVIGFDIQEEAIEETRKKILLTGLLEQTELHQIGHEKMDEIIENTENISAVIFNLGYLPQSDKKIITLSETTLQAIKHSLKLIRKGGVVLVMVYYGHEGGKEERDTILEFVQNLSQKEFDVLQYQFINQKNNPPFLLAIEKK